MSRNVWRFVIFQYTARLSVSDSVREAKSLGRSYSSLANDTRMTHKISSTKRNAENKEQTLFLRAARQGWGLLIGGQMKPQSRSFFNFSFTCRFRFFCRYGDRALMRPFCLSSSMPSMLQEHAPFSLRVRYGGHRPNSVPNCALQGPSCYHFGGSELGGGTR